jgi:CHASE2 domain-containing sensor protein
MTAIWLAAYLADAFRDLELDTVDTRFEIRGERAPPRDLIVVEIDAETFQELNRRWPFPRDRLRRPVDRVHLGRGRVLILAISEADGKVVLPPPR